MDSVGDYARQWAKREKGDLDTHSEWVKIVRSLTQIKGVCLWTVPNIPSALGQ